MIIFNLAWILDFYSNLPLTYSTTLRAAWSCLHGRFLIGEDECDTVKVYIGRLTGHHAFSSMIQASYLSIVSFKSQEQLQCIYLFNLQSKFEALFSVLKLRCVFHVLGAKSCSLGSWHALIPCPFPTTICTFSIDAVPNPQSVLIRPETCGKLSFLVSC